MIPELPEIDRFLTLTGKANLLEYYDLTEQSDPAAIEQALTARRSWAQGQQANPKFKAEALALIRQHRVIRSVLTGRFADYVAVVRSREPRPERYDVAKEVASALVDRTLSFEEEGRIVREARELGLSEVQTRQLILEVLDELGAARELGPEERSDIVGIDLYALLELKPDATESEIEAAYLARYRWARNLADIGRSSEVLQQLDLAWRTLRSPERRSRYDHQRQVSDEEPSDPGLPLPPAPPRLSAPVRSAAVVPGGLPPGISVPRESESAGAALPPRPPPVGDIGARSVNLTTGPNAVRPTPQLVVDGPGVVVLRVGTRTVTHSLKVSNPGGRRMPGRVTCNERWLELPRPVLDAQAREQIIPVHIRPSRMPGQQADAVVRIITDHGQRAEIRFVVHRRSSLAPAIATLVALLLVSAGVLLYRGQAPAVPTGVLRLEISPESARVTRTAPDGRDTSLGSGSQHVVSRALNQGVTLTVEATGFLPQTVTVGPDPALELTQKIELEPDSPMDYVPKPNVRTGTLSPSRVRETVEKSADRVAACFPPSTTGTDYEAAYKVWVVRTGLVERVEALEPNFDVAAVQPCLNRVFRAIQFGELGEDVVYAVGVTPKRLSLSPKATATTANSP